MRARGAAPARPSALSEALLRSRPRLRQALQSAPADVILPYLWRPDTLRREGAAVEDCRQHRQAQQGLYFFRRAEATVKQRLCDQERPAQEQAHHQRNDQVHDLGLLIGDDGDAWLVDDAK